MNALTRILAVAAAVTLAAVGLASPAAAATRKPAPKYVACQSFVTWQTGPATLCATKADVANLRKAGKGRTGRKYPVCLRMTAPTRKSVCNRATPADARYTLQWLGVR